MFDVILWCFEIAEIKRKLKKPNNHRNKTFRNRIFCYYYPAHGRKPTASLANAYWQWPIVVEIVVFMNIFFSDSTNEKAKLTIFYIFCTNRNIPSLIISTDEAILRLALFLHERVKKPTVLGHEREKHYELSLYQTSKAYERKAEGFRHCFF